MWSEEELRDIEPDPPLLQRPATCTPLRNDLSQRNASRVRSGLDELTRGASVIYAPHPQGTHGNFMDASYRRIMANAAWSSRLNKAHSAKRQARPLGALEETRNWRELDSANSSDALLMNIFCYPRMLHSAKLCALLGIDPGLKPEFGVRSMALLREGHINATEIDMRIGDLLIEAKLTEADFQFAPMRLVQRHCQFHDVFDMTQLQADRRGIAGYQLIRGVLAAQAASARYCVVIDARRPELREAWYSVIVSVRSFDLQSRLRLLTWQEIASSAPARLRAFLAQKYGIQ